MKILDLFSGIGGISLGFASANFSEYDFSLKPNEQKAKNDGFFKTIAFCEIEPFCKKVLAKNYPNTKIYDDVKTLPLNELRGGGKYHHWWFSLSRLKRSWETNRT